MWCAADAIEAVATTSATYSRPEPPRVLPRHTFPRRRQDVLKEEETASQDYDEQSLQRRPAEQSRELHYDPASQLLLNVTEPAPSL